MKVVTILGARPQFIKAAAGSRAFKNYFNEIIIHTGQHYDENMSKVFFDEMGIPKPKYNLGIAGGTHAEMTGKMLIEIEKILVEEKPDATLVYGDTNSTLAGALAAAKLNIPVIHIEAGNRVGTLNNPEEINRILTDHISSLLFCATENSYNKLKNEGLEEKAQISGNIMYDSFLHFKNKPLNKENLIDLNNNKIELPNKYYYLTIHRQENTTEDSSIIEILEAMNLLEHKTIYPVHPRIKERIINIRSNKEYENIIFIQPVNYSTSVYLVNNSHKIVTDSGGLQCEAFYAEKQCLFVFDYVAWPETMVDNRNQLVKASREDILKKFENKQKIDPDYKPFGNGDAAIIIAKKIVKWLKERK